AFFSYVVAYVVGGITFIPLLLGIFLLHAYLVLPISQGPGERAREDNGPHHDDFLRTATAVETLPDGLKPRPHVPDVAAGYFAVCREYVPGGINGRPPERTTPAGAVVALESPSVYQSMYRSIFDRSRNTVPSIEAGSGKGKKARNVFYVVLRHGHLMLYDDSEQLEVRHVISLAHYDVDIFAGGDAIPEGELWIKRNCVRLTQRTGQDRAPSDPKPFYLFSDNCSEKEDFYHAMLQSQERSSDRAQNPPLPLKFNTPDLVRLVQQLHASEENLHTRWFNALIGRLFLSLYKTREIENFIWKKITSKIARVPKPALISSIHLQKVDMGNLPPFITNPKLKELTVDGDLTVEADVSYKGNFRLEICAIARIDLGPRIKAREVTIVLASILKKLEGKLLVRIKPPPSNRLWITFESPPHMEFSLEPIVSTRQITYGVILRAIESRIRETVNETLVLPNWDDIPFSDTLAQDVRGGIWANDSRIRESNEVHDTSIDHDLSTTTLVSDAEQLNVSSANSIKGPKGTPNSKGKIWDANAELDVGEEVTSNTADCRPSSKPKAMRSGSFAQIADPIVNMNSANASVLQKEDADTQTAAATMKTTISRPQLNSPIGSPSRPNTIHNVEVQPDRPGFTAMDSRATLDLSLDSSDSATSTKPSSSSSPALSQTSSFPLDRRQTFNQSLNSATAAAKKWLTSRQAAGLPASPTSDANLARAAAAQNATIGLGDDAQAISKPTAHSSISSLPSNLASESLPQLGSPGHPIGRGQPLPPVGTPLPPPPK
ncbi:hypothetical protein BS50DRAFT_443482, partial [Corynespora cassiicola Philippines]